MNSTFRSFVLTLLTGIAALLMLSTCDSNGGSTELNPTITDIQPESGPPGTEITITGNSFSPNPSENTVTFGGTSAPVNSATETQIETVVPEGVEPGNVQMEITVDGNTAMGPNFRVMEVLNNQIVFISDRDGDNEIFFMNADGSSPQQLTNNTAAELNPTISNDGTRIAFSSDRDGTEFDLYVMNVDGSDVQRITVSGERTLDPSWSPDDSKIVFSDDDNLFTVNPDGSGVMQLTDDNNRDVEPDWSPDGEKIVFISCCRQNQPNNLFTINPDGTGLRQLTDLYADSNPTWSPDGSKIAFTSALRDGEAVDDIFTINSDGTGLTQVTDYAEHDENPSWSPDGQMIAFNRSRAGEDDVFKINADGIGGLVNLTVSSSEDFHPHWSPVE